MAFVTVGLQTAIWNNNLKSIVLLVTYPLLILALVWLVAGMSVEWMAHQSAGYYNGLYDDPNRLFGRVATGGTNFVSAYWPFIIGAVGAWFAVAFLFHSRMIRALSGAKPVTRLQEPDLYNLLENLCISRGLPMPHLNIIETGALNAFASGIGRSSYAVTVTRGLMETLQPDELEAVLAHELTHIQNHDVRLLIVTVIFTGMIGFLCQLCWRSIRVALSSSRTTSRSNSGGRGGGGLPLVLLVLVTALALSVAYFLSLYTRFALSRRREYMADAGAVEITRNPEAMMRALMRISGRDHIPAASADIALMCIENRTPFLGLFATHPPIDKRINAIAALTGASVPALGADALSAAIPPRLRNRTTPWT